MPVSSSSNLTRQHRAQPSHRLSHSAAVIASKGLVRQKGASTGGAFSALTTREGSSSSLALRLGGVSFRDVLVGMNFAAHLRVVRRRIRQPSSPGCPRDDKVVD